MAAAKNKTKPKPVRDPKKIAAEQTLKKAAQQLERARANEAKAWARAQSLMKEAHSASDGQLTFQEIADIFGVTKARTYQICTGNRGGTKKAAGRAA